MRYFIFISCLFLLSSCLEKPASKDEEIKMPDILLDQWAYINHNAWRGGVHILPDNKIVYQNWLDGHIQYFKEYKVLDILDDESIIILIKNTVFKSDDNGKVTNESYNNFSLSRIVSNKHRNDKTKKVYDSFQWYEGCWITEDHWLNQEKYKKELISKASLTLTDGYYCYSNRTPYTRMTYPSVKYSNASNYPIKIEKA